MVGTTQPQRVGVRAVVRGHLRRQLSARLAPRARGVVDLVVDVGDVDHEADVVALVPEEARQQAEDDERARVADVDAAVDRRTARVDPHAPGVARAQRQHLAAERVVQNDLSHRRATLAGGAGRAACLIDEGGERTRDVGRSQRAEPQCPCTVELLAEGMRHAVSLELIPVLLCSLVARGALECRVEPIPAIVHRPDREPVGYRPGTAR